MNFNTAFHNALAVARTDAKSIFDHLTIDLAHHPKTGVIIAFVVGFIVGLIL